MPKVTENKKERWISRLNNAKDIVNHLYSEVSDCGIPDEKIDFLSNMTCNFDEAMAEIENLELHNKGGAP